MTKPFSYIGEAKTAPEFVTYVASYNFGTVLPDQLVIHNSANPDASWAPLDADPRNNWDRDEVGLTEAQIKAKRKKQLDAIMVFYRDTNDWAAGPHLFVDERWIWLFTPMYDIGVHAMEGNSYHDAQGRLHYSVGIETIGWFGKVGWPAPMQALLRVAVQALRAELRTFEIVYKSAPRHRPELHQGSVAFHRDYNKAECPGAIITPEYAIPILAAPPTTLPPPPPRWRRYQTTAPCAVLTDRRPDAPLAKGPDGGQTRLEAGKLINVGDVTGGWLWVSDDVAHEPGIGFIPASYARPA